MHDVAILIPAAGASRRMGGRDKLMEPVDGVPLLRRQAKRACATGAHVAVTLPDAGHARAEALSGLPVQIVTVPDADRGMSASLRRGIGLLPAGIVAAMILPADMPDLTAEDITRVIDAFFAGPSPMLHQATAEDGTPGHPVLFPADCFPAFRRLQGDEGARSVLRANRHRLRQVPLPGRHALTDLDTPEAWEAWRQGRV